MHTAGISGRVFNADYIQLHVASGEAGIILQDLYYSREGDVSDLSTTLPSTTSSADDKLKIHKFLTNER